MFVCEKQSAKNRAEVLWQKQRLDDPRKHARNRQAAKTPREQKKKNIKKNSWDRDFT